NSRPVPASAPRGCPRGNTVSRRMRAVSDFTIMFTSSPHRWILMRCLAHVSLTFAALWVLTNPVVLHAREEVPDHWFVDRVAKFFPAVQAKEPSSRQLRLGAARNSHPTLQLALRAHQRVDGVTAGVEGWDKAAARSIGVQIRLVGYVVVAKNTTDTPESE